MAILTRVSRLLAADLHAVIDRLEEPQAQLQQAIREMQQLTAELEQQQHQNELKLHSVAEQQQTLRVQRTATDEELELCLDAGQDKLARAVVRRSLQIQANLTQLHAEQKRIQAELDHQSEHLAEHQAQLNALTAQAQLLDNSASQAQRTNSGVNPMGQTITEAQIDIALLAHQQRREQS